MTVRWECEFCDKEFDAEMGPTAVCPFCGRTIEPGPPFGLLDQGPRPRIKPDYTVLNGHVFEEIQDGLVNGEVTMDLGGGRENA